MAHRSSSVLSPSLLIAFALGLALVWAGTASATTAQMKVKVCLAKRYTQWDDEVDKDKGKKKYKKFIVDGRIGSPIAWLFAPDFVLSFSATLDSPRKATYVKDAGLDPVTIENFLGKYKFDGGFNILDYSLSGKRTVDKKFKKSKDKFNLNAEVEFIDGPNLGRILKLGLRASCKGKRVKER